MASHYNKDYFAYQIKSGNFAGKGEMFKFKKYVRKEDKVLDFGCGGGFILKNLECKEKLGIEINPAAIEIANHNNISTVPSISEVPDNWADVVISNHALEHVEHPLDILTKIKSKVKVGGKVIFVFPHEIRSRYKENDINQHLYTWSPMNAGNLFTRAGFSVESSVNITNTWPPNSQFIWNIFGETIFQHLSRFYGLIKRSFFRTAFYQTKVVAVRVNEN